MELCDISLNFDMILCTFRFDLFDMPPVSEYELYMRQFGGSNTKQVGRSLISKQYMNYESMF